MASDNFTDNDGTGLEDHDSNWTSISVAHPVTNLEINSNIAEHEGTWDDSGAYYDGSSEDFSQIIDKAHSSDGKHVAVRAGADQRGYAAHLSVVVEENWTQLKVTKNGVFLATLTFDGTWATAIDHIIKITASGTTTVTIECFVDGVSQGTTEDSEEPLGPGHPGFWTAGGGVVTNSRWDDWTDGTGGINYQFTASIAGITVTSDIALAVSRKLTALIQGNTLTADVLLQVARQFSADISMQTLTSAITLITEGLGVIIDPSIESLTIERTLSSLTVNREIESLTVKRTIHEI